MNRSVPLASLCLMVACAVPTFAAWDDPEAGHPAIRSFGSADYGELGGNQGMARDPRGRLYVCNDRLLEFNGRTWSKIQIGDAHELRSIALDEVNRLWICGAGELGYLDENRSGARTYHSLNAFLLGDTGAIDPWYVFRRHGRTLFVLRDSVLIWDGSSFTAQSLPTPHRLFAFPFRDSIAVWQTNGSLWLWRGETLDPISDQLPNDAEGMWGVTRADGIELFGTNHGLFQFTEGGFTPLVPSSSAANDFQRYGLVVGAVLLPDGNICIASFSRGLMIIRPDGSVIRELGRQDGLPSVECNALLLDDQNGLWVSTARHVFRMDARNAETLFDSFNGLEHGATTLVVPHGDTMIAAGDEAALSLTRRDDGRAAFVPLRGSIERIHDAASLPDGRLLLSTLGWIRIHTGPRLNNFKSGKEYYRLLPVGDQPSIVLASGFHSVDRLDVTDRISAVETPLTTLSDVGTDLSLDHRGVLWAATATDGLFSVPYQTEGEVEPTNWKRGGELPVDFNKPRFFLLSGETYAYTDKAALRLTTRGDRVPVSVLQDLSLLTVERSGDTDIWAVSASDRDEPRLVHIKPDGAALTTTAMQCRSLSSIGRALCIARDTAGRMLWIGGTTGLLRVEIASLSPEPPPPAPTIMRVVWHTANGESRLPLTGAGKLPFETAGTIDFDLRDARAVLDGSGRLEARLVGFETAWTQSSLLRTYSGLREDAYTFEARALDLAGKPGPVTTFKFTILPPWQRSGWAYAGYFAALLAAVFGGIRFRTRRVAKLNVQLEGLVNSRTEELTRAVAARSAFLANMGHEIRNPLNGVVGLVESLRADQLDAGQQQIVDRLGSCAAQLVSVVEDVMEYARVDAGRVSLRRRAFTIREAVDAAIDVLRAAAPQCEIELDAPPAVMEAHVVGDPDRIRQILVNYLANALKFGGGSLITVALRREGATTTFAVTDRGPGIPENEQARLFVRFSRGSLAHQKAIPGTGLGLAACKAYAEAMGGEVGVESEPGLGSTFFLRLPLPTATEADNTPTIVTPDIMVGRAALVVDDHEFNRIVLTDLLGRMGASAVSAPDIPAAREAFVARVPDVVFVDFDLAGVTGADLAHWIRTEAPVGRDVPIVATSAFEVDEVRQRCEEAGMDGFVVKPVTPQKIVSVMARIEVIRTGGIAAEVQAAPSVPGSRLDALDLLSDGDPKRRADLERDAWRVVLSEALNCTRAITRGNITEAGQAAHRLISAAQLLGLREIVNAAREVNGAARAGKVSEVETSVKRLRRAVSATRRQLKG